MKYNVKMSDVAGSHLEDLLAYLADKAGEMTAETYLAGVRQFCKNLANFPRRGRRRKSAIIPDLHTLPYKGSVTIAYTVDDDTAVVTIIGLYPGGMDYESYLEIDTSDE